MALAAFVLASPTFVLAQSNPHDVPRDETVFVDQAPDRGEDTAQVAQEPANSRSSSAYLTDQITPESIAAARSRAAEQEQLARQQEQPPVAQLSQREDNQQGVAQLSDGNSAQALAQLTEVEREVVLEAVEGTDICEQAQNIPAIQALCDGRIETRSAEVAQASEDGSAEDNLLGGGFDAARLATLESAISRLAQGGADSANFSNQVIASVALDRAVVSGAQATAAEGDPTADLSAETQAVVNAIVQQLSGN